MTKEQEVRLLNAFEGVRIYISRIHEKRPVNDSGIGLSIDEYKIIKSMYPELTSALDDAYGVKTGRNLMIHVGNMGSTTLPQFIISNIVDVINERGADGALSWYKRVFETKKAAVHSVLCAWGPTTDEIIDLSNGLFIVPFHEIPPSIEKNRLASTGWENKARYDRANDLPIAFVQKFDVDPIFVDAADRSPPKNNSSINLVDLEKLAGLLAICQQSPVVVEREWSQFDDADLQKLHSAWMRSSHDDIKVSNVSRFKISEKHIVAIEDYLKASNVRGRVNLAVDRLNSALLRSKDSDKALDVSIALEILLSGDVRDEITFRLALRAALLLGKKPAQRKSIRATVKAIYNLRSQVVHSGEAPYEVKLGDKKIGTEELILKAISICAEVILLILNQNAFPKWEDLEVGMS